MMNQNLILILSEIDKKGFSITKNLTQLDENLCSHEIWRGTKRFLTEKKKYTFPKKQNPPSEGKRSRGKGTDHDDDPAAGMITVTGRRVDWLTG